MVESSAQMEPLTLESSTLARIAKEVSEYVDPVELSSIASDTCISETPYPTRMCGLCKRLPVEPIMDENENCEQYFCKP